MHNSHQERCRWLHSHMCSSCRTRGRMYWRCKLNAHTNTSTYHTIVLSRSLAQENDPMGTKPSRKWLDCNLLAFNTIMQTSDHQKPTGYSGDAAGWVMPPPPTPYPCVQVLSGWRTFCTVFSREAGTSAVSEDVITCPTVLTSAHSLATITEERLLCDGVLKNRATYTLAECRAHTKVN